jgi:hypothetical protein
MKFLGSYFDDGKFYKNYEKVGYRDFYKDQKLFFFFFFRFGITIRKLYSII